MTVAGYFKTLKRQRRMDLYCRGTHAERIVDGKPAVAA